MAQLSTKIKSYCEANGVSNVDFTKDVMLQDDSDGKGPYIKSWTIDGLTPRTDPRHPFQTNQSLHVVDACFHLDGKVCSLEANTPHKFATHLLHGTKDMFFPLGISFLPQSLCGL